MKPARRLTYLYCLLHARGPAAAARVPGGLAGLGRPRLLDAGRGLWLVVADAPAARYGAASIDRGLRDLEWVAVRALAHEAVVEHFARAGTVVPVKLLTLFEGDARALAQVTARRRALDRTIARIAGRREWGVRARLEPRAPAPPAGRSRAASARTPGTRFLLRKRGERDLGRRLAEEAGREADLAFRDLRRLADEVRRHADTERAPGSRVLLDAAFLVPAPATARFRAAVRRWAGRLGRRGCAVALTGPWPPYNFVGDAVRTDPSTGRPTGR